MYQDDSFGRAGYRGVRLALDRRGMEPVAVGVYPRNTTAVKTGLLDLRQGTPEAVIMIGAYQPGRGLDRLGTAYRVSTRSHDRLLRRQQRTGR